MFLRILLFYFGCICLTGCSQEYFAHHATQSTIAANTQSLSGFSRDTLSEIDFSLHIAPSKESKQALITALESAQQRIWMTIYILTEKDIIRALGDAKKRGVDVRVLYEGAVFGNPQINAGAIASLQKSGAVIKRTDPKRFVFTHAKYIIVDNTVFISTGNFSHSSFTTNRELIVETAFTGVVSELSTIFQADEEYLPIFPTEPHLLVSPTDARTKWTHLIEHATGSIVGWMQSFSDEALKATIAQKVASGVHVSLCMGDPKKATNNLDDIVDLRSRGVQIFTPKKPYTHAKGLLIDGHTLIVASTNFSSNSLDNNREIGIILPVTPDEPNTRAFRELADKECGGVN